ncbi:MAG: FecR domain-containing protein [Deltaproteobacteria bacterium]|nr:FecR domain-containing protein [Deltaproteobacteria bacterium]
MRQYLLVLFILIPTVILGMDIEGNIFLISGKEYKTRMKGSKEWITNSSDTVLKSGLRIKTDENTNLRIIVNNRFVVFASPDSDINFTKLTENEELITVLKGSIIVNAHGSKVKGVINTPTAEIIREKPAELLIRVNAQDGNTELFVLKDEVLVKNLIQSDNNYKTVKEGTFSKVLPQVLPTDPTSYRVVDIEETLKKIKVPLYNVPLFSLDNSRFDKLIEEFQFDPYFSDVASKKSAGKEYYTSPFYPVEFEKNMLMKNSTLFINVKQ